jgi:hypothetical protein
MTGKLFNTFFVSQVTMSMMPFVCVKQPSPNTAKILQEYPSVICGEEEHTGLLVVGIVSTLLSLAFVCAVIFALLRARRMLTRDRSSEQFMIKILFMIEDFRLECYHFNVYAKLQELCLSLVFVIFPDSVRSQVMSFSIILMISLVVVAKSWPLKSPLLNSLLLVVYSLLLIMLVILQEGTNEESAAHLVVFFGSLVLLSCAMSLAVAVVNRLVRGGDGQLFCIAQLQKEPNLAELAHQWSVVANLSGEELQGSLTHWQLYHVNTLATTLRILQPQGLIVTTMGAAAEAQNDKIRYSLSRFSTTAPNSGDGAGGGSEVGGEEEVAQVVAQASLIGRIETRENDIQDAKECQKGDVIYV